MGWIERWKASLYVCLTCSRAGSSCATPELGLWTSGRKDARVLTMAISAGDTRDRQHHTLSQSLADLREIQWALDRRYIERMRTRDEQKGQRPRAWLCVYPDLNHPPRQF